MLIDHEEALRSTLHIPAQKPKGNTYSRKKGGRR